MVSSLLRIVSLALCLIAVGWFVGFAVEQSKSASAHQQTELNQSAPASMRAELESSKPKAGKPSGLHKAIDDAFSTISSPFSGLTSSLSSQWTLHIVDTLLALLIYGFGLGYLSRVLRFGA